MNKYSGIKTSEFLKSTKYLSRKNGCAGSSMKPVTYKLSLIVVLTMLITAWTNNGTQNRETWEPLRWTTKSSATGPASGQMESAIERILAVFQKAGPLNPPKGLGIRPLAEFYGRPTLREDEIGPESSSLRLLMYFPNLDAFQPSAGVNVMINDPRKILGDAVIADESGEIFLLPPVIGKIGGQSVFARTAHPPGYKEEFPGSSLFPLWSNEHEPFLRSIVRPTFGLHKGSVSTVFTKGGRPFWNHVSQERWIMALISKAREEIDGFLAGVEAAEATGITHQQINQMQTYLGKLRKAFDEQSLIAQHEQTLEEMKKMHAMMVSMNPGEADKFYKEAIEGAGKMLEETLSAAASQRPEIETMEKKLLEALVTREEIWKEAEGYIRNRQWDNLDQMGREYDVEKLVFYADAGRKIEQLQAELNRLSPAQRNAPAYGFELPEWHPLGTHRHVVALPFEATRPSGLVDRGAKGARALISLDEDLLLQAGKDGEISFLGVEWWEELDARFRGEGGMFYNERRVTLLEDIWNSLDWAALRGMVR